MLLLLERKNDTGKSSMSSPCLQQGSIQHATGARVSVTCYWIFIVDRHFFSCALFRTISTGQVKYTRRMPKDVSGSWDGCPSNVKKRGDNASGHSDSGNTAKHRNRHPQEHTGTTKEGETEAREQKTRETQAHTGRAGSPNSLQILPHARFSGRRPMCLGAHWRIVGTSGPTRVHVWTWKRVAHASYLLARPWPSEPMSARADGLGHCVQMNRNIHLMSGLYSKR